MSVPLAPEPDAVVRVQLHALPDYEPTHEPGDPTPPRRWSSLRPPSGPQLTLVVPEQDPPPPPESLWRLLRHVLEVLDGRRAVGQLRTLLSDPAYEALLTRLRTTPVGRRHRLRRLHTCYPSTDAVEMSAVLEITGEDRGRVRAAAIRMERHEDRWHCAVLRIL